MKDDDGNLNRPTMSISKERLKKIEAIKDEDIDYSDIPELDEKFWRRAEPHMPQPKNGVHIALTPTFSTGSSRRARVTRPA